MNPEKLVDEALYRLELFLSVERPVALLLFVLLDMYMSGANELPPRDEGFRAFGMACRRSLLERAAAFGRKGGAP